MICADQNQSKFLNINNPFSGQIIKEINKNTTQIEQIAKDTQEELVKVQKEMIRHLQTFKQQNEKMRSLYQE
jgi:hypothetical protein